MITFYAKIDPPEDFKLKYNIDEEAYGCEIDKNGNFCFLVAGDMCYTESIKPPFSISTIFQISCNKFYLKDISPKFLEGDLKGWYWEINLALNDGE